MTGDSGDGKEGNPEKGTAVYTAELEEHKVRILGGRAYERTKPWPTCSRPGVPAQTPGSSGLLPDFPEQSQLLLGCVRPSLLAPRERVWHC